MMFSDIYFKNYVLFLFFGVVIVFLYIKIEKSSNNLFNEFKKTSEIEDSKREIQYYSRIVKFKNPGRRSTKSINFQEICTKYNLTDVLKRENFLYSPKSQALYCWIRKIASTSFTKIFSNIESNIDKFDRSEELLVPRSIELFEVLNEDADIFKFLTVRHPFERLVSSYRDRIKDNTKFTSQSWIYVPKIFYLTRPELFCSNSTTGSTLEKMFYKDRRLKLVPTFKEFVTYLIQESPANYDHHWNQYYRHCSLCEINYNFIFKLDNYSPKQISYIFSRLNLQRERHLINLHTTRGGLTDFRRTCEYFKNLSHETIFQLYEKYKVDFEMFGYEIEKYLQCLNESITF